MCGALAVLSANVAAVVPAAWLSGLHASHSDGATLVQLRRELSDLTAATADLRRANAVLGQRLALAENSSGEMTKRVGALEISIPSWLEGAPREVAVDRSLVTAAIGDGEPESIEGDGGSATVETKPLVLAAPEEQVLQEEPAVETAAAPETFGIALGQAVTQATAAEAWDALLSKLGPLLLGLSPLMSQGGPDGAQHLVAGPITDLSEAAALCRRLEKVSIGCLPVPYSGEPVLQ